MRFALALFAFALAASTADAQLRSQQSCPNGQCPLPSSGYQFASPGVTYSLPGGVYADPGSAPSASHELHLQGGRLVWVAKAGAVPKVMEAAKLPEPKFAVEPSTGRDKHGRMFYRVVKDRAYGQLVDKGMSPAKARKLVDTLSHESIDVYAQHVQISEGVGDGRLIDWLIDNRESILALIKLIVSLLAVL